MLRSIKYIVFTCAFFLLSIPNLFANDNKLPVFVSIAPQRYFVQQIGKDLVDVRVMVQPGADAYGLGQIPTEVEGMNPKPAHLKELIKNARGKNIKVIFVQPQFSTRNAELVAREIGGQVVFADPLAEDWMTNLREVADKFKADLR